MNGGRLTYAVSAAPPEPSREETPANNRVYPWRKLEVGHAFFVPCLPLHARTTHKRIRDAAYRWRRRFGMRLQYDIYRGSHEGAPGLWVRRGADETC